MYFDLRKLSDKYNFNLFNNTTFKLLILNAIRNIGKTTSTLNILMELTNNNAKMLFIKTTKEQLRNFINDFNNRYKGRFQIIGGNIYTIKEKIFYNKKLECDEIVFHKDEHIGYVADINNYQNYKSLEAKNLRWIVFDEYNQMDNIPLFFEKFINLVKTFERYNNITMIMLGNRDTPNNEIMVRLELIPQNDIPKDEDYVLEFQPNCYFVEMGTNQFKGLNNSNTLSNTLASMDKTLTNYLEGGGYLTNNTMKVLPFNKRIKDTFDVRYLLTFDDRYIAVGIWGEQLDKVAVVFNDYAIELGQKENLLTFAINGKGMLAKNAYYSSESIKKLLRVLIYEYKNDNVYFDSFELKEIFDKKLSLIATMEK